MKYLYTTAILACLCINPTAAWAQDHLEPERGLLNRFDHSWEYEQKLRETLLKGATPYYRARLLCLPSFGTEWMVTIVRENRGEPGDADDRRDYFLEYVGAESHIYSAKDTRKIGLTRHRMALDRETAEVVVVVWRRMLRDVHYRKKQRLVADGTTYHFSRGVTFFDRGRPDPQGGFEEGQIWSPEEGSLPAGLVAIGEDLKRYALAQPGNREKIAKRIRESADGLKVKIDARRKED